MFRPRRLWRKFGLIVLSALGLIGLTGVGLYVAGGLLPTVQREINSQKSVDRLNTWHRASRNRFRALCDSQPIVQWSATRQFWIPPVCPQVLIYSGEAPLEMVAVKNESDLRSLVKTKLGTDVFHIHVPDQSSFATLSQILGSDFPDQHWPAAVLLDQQSGNKFLWEPKSSGRDSRAERTEPFAQFLEKSSRKEWPQYLKDEALADLPLDGGTSPSYVPMHINSSFFEKYIANKTARATLLREKELFVVFHAPWCGHCRVFLSKFEPLAQQILKVSQPNIGFYKLDVTANDVADNAYRFGQVPTTIYFRRDLDNAIELTERRDVKTGLIEFLKAHSNSLRQKDYNEL